MVGGCDMDVVVCEFGVDPGGEGLELGFGIIAASDSRLIGDDDESVAFDLGVLEEVENTGYELEFVDRADVAVVDIDDAISV